VFQAFVLAVAVAMFSPMKNTIWTSILLALTATSCAQLGDSPAMGAAAVVAMDLGATPVEAWSRPVLSVYHVDSAQSGFQTTVEILKQGDGETVMSEDQVLVHYQGWVMDSTTMFDSSYVRGVPIGFQVGIGQVIEAWDACIVGMQVGTAARLVIPAEMGYGERGAGDVIPGNSTLIFEIEVVSTK
jgi:hypothetical protein